MMALELLDTKWAGVTQPDPDSAMDVRLVRSTNAWKSKLSRCRFRQAAITETSVHNAVQPVTHTRGACSGERSMNADHETTRRWLPSSVCRSASEPPPIDHSPRVVVSAAETSAAARSAFR